MICYRSKLYRSLQPYVRDFRIAKQTATTSLSTLAALIREVTCPYQLPKISLGSSVNAEAASNIQDLKSQLGSASTPSSRGMSRSPTNSQFCAPETLNHQVSTQQTSNHLPRLDCPSASAGAINSLVLCREWGNGSL